MLNSDIVQAWLDEAHEAVTFSEDPSVPEGVESLDASECDELLARLNAWAKAVRFLQDAARLRLVDHLGTRGFVRFGDRVYRASPDTKETLRPEMRTEFYRLVQDRGLVADVFPHYSARKTGLRTLAKDYVNRETGEVGWDAFLADFFDVEEGIVKVSEMPADRAPKFIQKGEDGAVNYRGDHDPAA